MTIDYHNKDCSYISPYIKAMCIITETSCKSSGDIWNLNLFGVCIVIVMYATYRSVILNIWWGLWNLLFSIIGDMYKVCYSPLLV